MAISRGDGTSEWSGLSTVLFLFLIFFESTITFLSRNRHCCHFVSRLLIYHPASSPLYPRWWQMADVHGPFMGAMTGNSHSCSSYKSCCHWFSLKSSPNYVRKNPSGDTACCFTTVCFAGKIWSRIPSSMILPCLLCRVYVVCELMQEFPGNRDSHNAVTLQR